MAKDTPKVVEVVPHLPTAVKREQVEKMVACGLDINEIAYILKCTPTEVTEHYAQEIEFGMAATTATVGGAVIKAAIKGDMQAAKLFLQARAHWITPNKVELTGKDGGPVEVQDKKRVMDEILQLMGLTPEQGAQLEKMAKATPPASGRLN